MARLVRGVVLAALVARAVATTALDQAACAALTPPGRRESAVIRAFSDTEFAIGREGCADWQAGEVYATAMAVAGEAGRLVVTSSNAGFREFTDSWVASLRLAGVEEYLIIAEDI